MQEIIYYWDVFDRLKLCNNLVLVTQGRANPNKILYDTICEELAKSYIKLVFNLR